MQKHQKQQAEDNPNNNNKEVVFKYCAPCTDCINEISNAQLDNAKDIDACNNGTV